MSAIPLMQAEVPLCVNSSHFSPQPVCFLKGHILRADSVGVTCLLAESLSSRMFFKQLQANIPAMDSASGAQYSCTFRLSIEGR